MDDEWMGGICIFHCLQACITPSDYRCLYLSVLTGICYSHRRHAVSARADALSALELRSPSPPREDTAIGRQREERDCLRVLVPILLHACSIKVTGILIVCFGAAG